MLGARLHRTLRRALLWYVRRLPVDGAVRQAQNGAWRAAEWAARVSPAYRTLLAEHGVDMARFAGPPAFDALPVLTKSNTFARFPLAELARPVAAADLADVLTSSGRSGHHFGFRLSDRRQHEGAWFNIDLGLEDAFQVDTLPTLLVNCLPMGVVFRSRAVAVANVSVREDMACAVLRDVGPRFAQTLLCTDPLFIRRLLDEGDRVGVDWKALNTSVIMGEEMLVEAQRSYVAERMGIDLDADPHRIVASSFGIGELGLNLLFESRETIRLRRAARRDPAVAALLGCAGDDSLPSVFCWVPQRLHIEALAPDADGYGELCFTLQDRSAIIPLPRFASGDVGRLVPRAVVEAAARAAGIAPPWLPVVLVRGRAADRAKAEPSVEDVKEMLYADPHDAGRLTGAFRSAPGELLVQAVDAAAATDDGLRERLTARTAALAGTPALRLVAPEDFPGRPLIDYERKFAYVRPRP